MRETREGRGSCLCGAVRLTARRMPSNVGACHCGMCRKWTGGPLLAIDCGTEVAFEGKERIGAYTSSPWAERGFCTRCGTHLFYLLKKERRYFVPAGLFEGLDDASFEHQVFIDDKPAWYAFANQTKTMTGAEVFAQFAP